MLGDRIGDQIGEGPLGNTAVMPHGASGTKAPQRWCPHLVLSSPGLSNEVRSQAHVVQQEVGIGANGLVAKERLEGRVVRGGERWVVALRAAHLIEQLLSPHARTGRLGWGRKEPLEIRHAVDEVEAFRVGSVLWIGNRVALRDGRRQDAVGIVLGGDQSVGQSHFFSGRITAERKNGGQLAFPAEAAHSSGSWIFKQWDDVRSPAYARPTGLQSQEVGIGDGFHQAVAQHADGESVGHDVGHGRQFFSAGQINARDLEQGAAVFLELDESLFFVFHAEANHGLAAMAADRVVVAVGAGLLVEDRPQAILGDEGGVVELGPGLKTGGVRGIKA